MKNGPKRIAKKNKIHKEKKKIERKITLLQYRFEQFIKKTEFIGKGAEKRYKHVA